MLEFSDFKGSVFQMSGFSIKNNSCSHNYPNNLIKTLNHFHSCVQSTDLKAGFFLAEKILLKKVFCRVERGNLQHMAVAI